MKYFSNSSVATFHTYTINGGEYVQDIDLEELILSFSKLIDMGQKLVWMCFSDLEDSDNAETRFGKSALTKARDDFTPNEWHLLVQLHDFYNLVQTSLLKNGWGMNSHTLLLCDLNSGKQLSWVHSVC